MWNMRFSWGLRISAILKFKVDILTSSGQIHGYALMMTMGQQVLCNFCTNLHGVTSHKIIKVKKGEVFSVYAMKVYIGSRGTVQLHSFLTSALDEREWPASSPITLNPRKHLRYALWMVSFKPRHCNPAKIFPVPII